MNSEKLVMVDGGKPAILMTKQAMLDRINTLSDEIDSNEEENRLMQAEITTLYAKIDAGEFTAIESETAQP